MVIVVALIVVLGGTLVLLVIHLGRLVVGEPGSHHQFGYTLGSDGSTIIFSGEPATRMPGEYGLWFADGKEGGAHALVGPIVSTSRDGAVVERTVLKVSGGELVAHKRGLWTGHVFSSPKDLGVPFTSIALAPDGQGLPGWVFESRTGASAKHWMVHIHGIRTTRLTTLRNVQVAADNGFVSIVPTFRTDEENVNGRSAGSTLGLTEWQDVDLAVTYAREHGAESVILFGLSLGGMIALLLTKRSRNLDLIKAAILVGPVTNFAATIIYGATQMGLPAWVGRLAMVPLKSKVLHKLTGTSERIDFSKLTMNRGHAAPSIPILIIQTPIDDEVPYGETVTFVADNPATVTLDSSLRSFHTCEWNVSPARFGSIVEGWLAANDLTVDRPDLE